MNAISHDPQGKWYPPQQPPRPGYHMAGPSQASGIPAGPPPQPRAFPETIASVKGIGAKFSVTAALLFGGFVVAAIALFLPWVTVSAKSPLLGTDYRIDASPFQGGWIFLVLLVIAGAAWLAWPTISGSKMVGARLAGLTAVVGIQILFLVIGFADYANGISEKNKVMGDSAAAELAGIVPDVSIGAGMFLYAAAVIAIVVGLVRVWTHRSNAQPRTS